MTLPNLSAMNNLPPPTPGRCKRLAFALDYPTLAEAEVAASQVGARVGVLKVGLELFIQGGPASVRLAQASGADVFLDLKLHDIAKTVERAVAVASQLGVKFLTLHASGGPGMLEAAAARAQREATGLTLLGVTVLTSLDAEDLAAVGVSVPPSEQVLRLARLAGECGVGGLVCSAQEVAAVRQTVGAEMVLVTPGIRPVGSEVGDQKRVASPREAILAGSNLLVVGRPIRDSEDPEAAAVAIAAEIESVEHT
jgi:orotidine-5'-phosphate decarboxylase